MSDAKWQSVLDRTVLCRPRARVLALLMRSVALCFAIAFFSIYTQAEGLFGFDGVTPIRKSLPKRAGDGWRAYQNWLHWLPAALGLNLEDSVDAACLGAGTGALIMALVPRNVPFAVLWYLYLGVFLSTETFLHFQWDILLLEIGFLCVIVSPLTGWKRYQNRPYHQIKSSLVKWLLFRMMFASGCVKLTSGCPAWWGLTALPVHYESQCLPTAPAWYAYNYLPEWMHKISVIGTYLIEIPLTFLFFAPTQGLKKLTFWAQIMLMISIMATGNYNFFNILYIALCLSLMDDSWLYTGSGNRELKPKAWLKLLIYFVNVAVSLGAVFLTLIYCFKLNMSSWSIAPELQFNKKQFERFVASSAVLSVQIGFCYFLTISALALWRSLRWNEPFMWKIITVFSTVSYACVAMAMFGISVPNYMYGLGQRDISFLPKEITQTAHELRDLQLANSYGLFRSMTGVGGRPEVVLEAALSPQGPWKELHFRYKPGKLDAAPRFCIPHQPRLDWQMWFAALGSYHHNPWLISCVWKLLQGNPTVYNLLDPLQNSFSSTSPPKYIKASLYKYHFTSNSSDINWWYREKQGDFLPPIGLDNSDVIQFLSHHKYTVDTKPSPGSSFLRSIRILTQDLEHHVIPVTASLAGMSILWELRHLVML